VPVPVLKTEPEPELKELETGLKLQIGPELEPDVDLGP
jgi:hypothetical protein